MGWVDAFVPEVGFLKRSQSAQLGRLAFLGLVPSRKLVCREAAWQRGSHGVCVEGRTECCREGGCLGSQPARL